MVCGWLMLITWLEQLVSALQGPLFVAVIFAKNRGTATRILLNIAVCRGFPKLSRFVVVFQKCKQLKGL